jgi:hypothetical protein
MAKRKRIRCSSLGDARATVKEHALLYRKARNGDISMADFSRYSAALANHRNMLESTQTEEKLGEIEARIEQLMLADGRTVVQFKKPA